MKEIVAVVTVEQVETTRQLFREYETWLDMDLCFQSFEEETQNLPGKYASPEGRLYLANIDGEAAGCIGLRKIGDGICEMKAVPKDAAPDTDWEPMIEKIIAAHGK